MARTVNPGGLGLGGLEGMPLPPGLRGLGPEPLRALHAGRMGPISVVVSSQFGTTALRMEAWAELMEDWTGVLADIARLFWAHQRRHFASEGAATGERWPSNSEPTVPIVPGRHGGPYDDYKRRFAPGAGTLEFTGRLKAAATGGRGAISEVTRRMATLGVSSAVVPYAVHHHRGDKVESVLFRRQVQLKRRPIIRFDGSPLAPRAAVAGGRPGTFGYAVRQIVQAHVTARRRLLFGLPIHAQLRTLAVVAVMPTR